MIRASIVFFFIGLLSMVLGAYNVAGLSFEVGRTLLFGFLLLATCSLVASLIFRSSHRPPL